MSRWLGDKDKPRLEGVFLDAERDVSDGWGECFLVTYHLLLETWTKLHEIITSVKHYLLEESTKSAKFRYQWKMLPSLWQMWPNFGLNFLHIYIDECWFYDLIRIFLAVVCIFFQGLVRETFVWVIFKFVFFSGRILFASSWFSLVMVGDKVCWVIMIENKLEIRLVN